MEKVTKVFFWCMVMGFAVFLIWFGMIVFAGESIHALHTEIGTLRMVPVELFMSANYMGIGIWKMCVIFAFAIPWLALKVVDHQNT